MSGYYHARLRDISDPEIPAICNELLAASGYAPDENFGLTFFMWFRWYFHEVRPKDLHSNHFLPGSLLTTKIEKLTGRPLYALIQEVALHNHEFFEAHANITVLSFFKKIARKLQKK